jgi:UDP-N-acetylmuramyl pentapeptide phosphotransferase/UDP-N-acetylglucosamine-1-phosphate transferase
VTNALTLDLWNSILPLVLLCGLVVLLPGWIDGRGNLSHARLARAVGVTALVALVVGAVLAAGLYAAINEGVWAGVLAAPLERAGFFLGRSTLFALLWGPVLGFVWLVKAQELNGRLGMRMVDGEGGKG